MKPMIKYLKVFAFLITRFARKINRKLPFNYFGDSIMWGYMFVNVWISITIFDLIIDCLFPGIKDTLYINKAINPIVGLVVFFMIIEFFIFFSKDQWKEFIPAIEKMDRKKRRKLCWRVIWFLIIAFPLSVIALLFKYPMLTTWTG